MELGTPAYRISLLKNKCIAGTKMVVPGPYFFHLQHNFAGSGKSCERP